MFTAVDDGLTVNGCLRRHAARPLADALCGLLALLFTCSGLLLPEPLQASGVAPSAWNELQERHPELSDSTDEADRRILRLLTWTQAMDWVEGVDPSRITLADGRSLAALLGNGYELSWWTIDSGGGMQSGGGFLLQGTVGQPDAGRMAGGGFSLSGGFWPQQPASALIFSDGFEASAVPLAAALTGSAFEAAV